MNLKGKTVLITGAARRLGRLFSLTAARAGANVLLHYNTSSDEAEATALEIRKFGVSAWLLQADLSQPEAVMHLIGSAWNIQLVDILVNSASHFEPLTAEQTTLDDWQQHMMVNLTAPFLLSQAFAQKLPPGSAGKIINILDWRALRPGADHFPYTISKAGLAALTRSTAIAFAPHISVNGLALGAILPPISGTVSASFLEDIPTGRWAHLEEVERTFLFLLEAPDYITGEIIHLDGGRHLI
jgi:pteridine reductase